MGTKGSSGSHWGGAEENFKRARAHIGAYRPGDALARPGVLFLGSTEARHHLLYVQGEEAGGDRDGGGEGCKEMR